MAAEQARSKAAAPASSSVLARAVRGGSYLFLQRVLTFALNSLVLRKLRLSVTGAVTVRLELALASVFLLRDGFRLAFLRMPSLDGEHIRQVRGLGQPLSASTSDSDKTGASKPTEASLPEVVRPLVNVAWLSTAVSWAIASAVIAFTLLKAGAKSQDNELSDYPLVMAMYCLAAMLEALAEPMYVLAHCSVLVSWQVSAQAAAFLVRGVVQYACIFVLDLGLLAYGLAEMSYALTLLLVFAVFFWRRMRDPVARDSFALDSMSQLLPRAPLKKTNGWFQSELLVLLVPFSLQSGVKYLLTEGDKWVLSMFATFQNMGVYGIVFHLGSLVPRMVFLPIEEATKTIFSKLSASSENQETSGSNGRGLLMLLLKLMHLVGLTFSCFGANYAPTLVLLLYGAEKARMGVGDALAVYCVYIHFLGLNGVCEAVVHAVGDEKQLMRLNKLMGAFFVVYALSALAFMQVLALGTVGIILANCVNMACRIAYCLRFLAKRFPSTTDKSDTSAWTFLSASLPDRFVVAAFTCSFLVTATSKSLLLSGSDEEGAFRWSESWTRHALHAAVGVVCLAVVALALFVKERRELRDQIALLQGSRSAAPPPADQKKQHKE